MQAFWNFWQPMNFWKFLLALVLIGLIIKVIEILLVVIGILLFIGTLAALCYGLYRLLRFIVTRHERRIARLEAAIAQEEQELGIQ